MANLARVSPLEQEPVSSVTVNDHNASVQPAPRPTSVIETAPLWHLGWAVGVLAAAGVLLVTFGALPIPAIMALAIAAAPGLVGYFWRPVGQSRLGLLAVWTVGSAAAAAAAGGVVGPMAILSVTPMLAGVLIGRPAEGVVFAAISLAVVALVQLAGSVPPPLGGLFGTGLAACGLIIVGGAAAAVFGLLAQQGRVVLPAAEVEPISTPEPADTTAEPDALSREQVARSVAEARIKVLETKLLNTEKARNQALNALSGAKAAVAAAEKARDTADAGAVAKSRFLANMSHELRTPLNAIMGFSDIMRQRMFGELTPKYGEYAELIHESGRHLTDLINDVLDMSKIEAERYSLGLDVFDAREPVSGALRLMRLQADDVGVHLRGVLPQGELVVEADRRALKQIALNLISNALKFTPAGGSVTITLQAVGEALEMVVVDTGVGIAKEDLDRLGKPFEQAGDADHRAQGTGLGLSLVRAFARLHGGEMSIESELGEGAAVTVRLPVLHHEDEPQVVAPAPVVPASSAHEPVRMIPVGEDAISTTIIGDAPPFIDDGPHASLQSLPLRSADIISLNLPRN